MQQIEAGQKIAIVGGGISGLTCAYLLRHKFSVTLFEKNDYIGGHTHTIDVEHEGKVYPVNTGFIVYNDWTYPNFIELMKQLDVATETSDMSFSVRSEVNGLEYNGTSLNSLFAQRSNILSPRFLWMVKDILRFNNETTELVKKNRLDPTETLGAFLQRGGYSDYFKCYYIIPMGAAIWSCGEDVMMSFPLAFFLKFFSNHGMLSVDERPQWRTVSGGSRSYVTKMLALFGDLVVANADIKSVDRDDKGVTIRHGDGTSQEFDHVIFACHSDEALALLGSPTKAEQDILGAIPYQPNEVVLHTDHSLLPKKRLAWASWNYHITKSGSERSTVALTYYMNLLQNFDSDTAFCVTLNQTEKIDPDKIIATYNYSHPVYTVEGMKAQQRHSEINNHNLSHFCGAYWFNGFHEDGVVSALRVAKTFGCEL